MVASASSASSYSPRRKRNTRPRTPPLKASLKASLKLLPKVEERERDTESRSVTTFPVERQLRRSINEFYSIAREQHRAFRAGAYADAEQLAFKLLQRAPLFYKNVARLLQCTEETTQPPTYESK